MKDQLLIKNATIVNERRVFSADVLLVNGLIDKIAPTINKSVVDTIDASGLFMFPGVIDPHVHFREPGLTHKADIQTESAAAVAGGVTSFMDMPNTIPNTTNRHELAEKYAVAAQKSFANFGCYFGITNDNIDELKGLSANECCAVTDDGLYFTNRKSLLVEQPELLREVLKTSPKIVAIHSEFESIVNRNLAKAIAEYGNNIPVSLHAQIRSEEACYDATRLATEIANETNGRLHILHVSTAKELEFFSSDLDVRQKKITAEACIHHLYFSIEDYDRLGAKIKWNPSIKTSSDRDALLKGLRNNLIDIVGTDHAPHVLKEKEQPYTKSPGGGPMVQHSLVAMLELAKSGHLSVDRVAELMCHNVAELYRVRKRGYIREGYHADLALVDMKENWQVYKSNILSKCRWSPFEGEFFTSKVKFTLVNGAVAYADGVVQDIPYGTRLEFD